MVKQAILQWKRMRRYLAADPGRFAGGSAVSDPLGLLAIERERLTAPPWLHDDASQRQRPGGTKTRAAAEDAGRRPG